MHILFLTDNFPPETNAPASRTYEHARQWVAAGHKVTIITCAPNFPDGKVFAGYKNKLWQQEDVDGIRVIRVWSYMTANEGFLKRILDYQSYMISSFFAALFVRRVDVVVGTSPQFFTAVSAWATAALKRRPFVFELRDLWPESIRAVGAIKGSKVLDLFERVELFLYRRAKLVISVTHSFKENLIQRGISGDKIEVVTNGVDLTNFSAQPKDQELLEQLDLEGKFVAGYIGTHGMAHALETLLSAAAILQTRADAADIRILFLGSGGNRDKLIKTAEDMGLDNVMFLPAVSKEQVRRYWSILDVSIIHLRKTDLFKTVIPSKMFECFGMGLPILHGVQGESADILHKVGGGLTFEPENAQDLCDKLLGLYGDPAQHKKLQDHASTGALWFDRKHLAGEMLEHLKQVIEG